MAKCTCYGFIEQLTCSICPNDSILDNMKENRLTEDPIVDSVVNKFIDRSKAGMTKYGISMKDNPLNFVSWARHAQEELMDGILYLERAIEEYNERKKGRKCLV